MRVNLRDLDLRNQLTLESHRKALVAINRSPNTIYDRIRVMVRLAEWLSRQQTLIPDASPVQLADYQQTFAHLAKESRRSYTCHIRGYYDWLSLYTGANAAQQLIVPKVPRHLPRPAAEDDLAFALRALQGRPRMWLILGAFAGLRAGEVAAIEKEDAVPADEWPGAGKLYVHAKGGKERIVPLAPPVWAELQPWLIGRGPCWFRPRGGRWTGQSLSRKMGKELHGIGLDWTLHNFRHRFATQHYLTQKDLRVLQILLGHESPNSTVIYTLVDIASTMDGVAAIAAPLGMQLGELANPLGHTA